MKCEAAGGRDLALLLATVSCLFARPRSDWFHQILCLHAAVVSQCSPVADAAGEQQETEEPKWSLSECFWGILLKATLLTVAAAGVSLGMFPAPRQGAGGVHPHTCCWKTSQCPTSSWLLAFKRVEGWDSSKLMRQLWMSHECVLLLWCPSRYWQLTERFMCCGLWSVTVIFAPHVETKLCLLTTFNAENVWGLVLQTLSLF